jgi:hypothetical protein
MSETIVNKLQESTNLVEYWSPKTLQYIENDVFYKQELPDVRKTMDDAFIALLRSEACDDDVYRNLVLDSWFANSKLHRVVELKEIPDNIIELHIHYNL